MNRAIEVKGEGQIESASVVQSFLRKRNLLELKLKEGEKERIPLIERDALTILQDNDKDYLLSSQNFRAYGDYALRSYFIDENPTSRRFLHPEPEPTLKVSYATTDPGQVILDNFYNGNQNTPSFVFRDPFVTSGPKSFCIEYMPMGVLDLKSREKKIIAPRTREILAITQDNGNILIGATIPASIVPSLIKEGRAGVLEDVFNKEDIEKVAQLNKKNDENHMCLGDHSCIPRDKFEFAQLEGYPKYKLNMDTTGKIYTAERVVE